MGQKKKDKRIEKISKKKLHRKLKIEQYEHRKLKMEQYEHRKLKMEQYEHRKLKMEQYEHEFLAPKYFCIIFFWLSNLLTWEYQVKVDPKMCPVPH